MIDFIHGGGKSDGSYYGIISINGKSGSFTFRPESTPHLLGDNVEIWWEATTPHSSSVTLPSAYRSGYNFTGWYTSPSCTYSSYVGGAGSLYTRTASYKELTDTPDRISCGDVDDGTALGDITLYAGWEPATATLRVDPNGGVVSVDGSYISSTTSYTRDTNSTISYGTPTQSSDSWNSTCTLTYNYNGNGQANTSQTVDLTTTTRYTFDGWAKSSYFYGSLSNSLGAGTYTFPSTSGVTSTITATWTTSTSISSSAVTVPSPTRTGYTFGGWYTNSSCTGSRVDSDGTYTPTANTTLYAKWISNTYTVKYNGNGATGGNTASSSHTYGTAKNLTANGFTRSYTVTYNHNYTGVTNTNKTSTYTFKNWNTKTDGSGATYNNSASVNNLTATNGATINLYAQWNSASVSYTPTRTGYTFGGWYTNAEGTGNRVDTNGTYTPTANITLYAKWTANTYTVKYNGNGATSGSTANSSHTYGTAKNLTANGFARAYTVTYNDNYSGSTNTSKTATYSFKNWNTKTDGTGTAYNDKASVNNLTAINGETVNLYAQWNVENIEYVPTRTGYTFGGWYTNAEGTGNRVDTNGTYAPSANTTLYAKWTVNTYTVKYNGNGATGGSTASSNHAYGTAKNLTANGFTRNYTVTYNHNYTGVTNTSKTATYTFKNWNTKTDGTGTTYNNSVSVNNLTATNGATINLYAQWNSASVSYTPTRTGYTFGGWYTNAEGTGNRVDTNGTYTPSANTTLYAKWTANTYTVKYNGNGATSGSTANSSHTYGTAKNLTANGFARAYTVTYNHNYSGSTNTSKTATYTFKNWNTKTDGSGTAYNNSASVNNLTATNGGTVNLYAQWNSASVSYTPTREGYIFGGWYKEAACTTKVSDGTYIPSTNITLYAKWELDLTQAKELKYTVEYYKNGTKIDADTQEVKKIVQILEPETITVDKTKINIANKYRGYKLEKINKNAETISSLPDTVSNKDIIKIYYIIDEGQTKKLSYTIENVKDGKTTSEVVEKEVQVLQPDTLELDKKKVDPETKPKGYKIETIEVNGKVVTKLPDEVPDKSVIKVTYVIDESQTKELKYTVEYYKNGTKVEEDTQVEKLTVQVLETSTAMTVNKSKINTTDKYVGYKFEKTEINTQQKEIPNTVNDKDVIKIYYIIDEEQIKEIGYTIQYVNNGKLSSEEIKETVQVLKPDELLLDKPKIKKKLIGYKIEKIELNGKVVAELPDLVPDGSIVKITCAIDESQTKDLSYTIEYVKDGEKTTEEIKETVHVLEPDTLDLDKEKVGPENKPTGYKIESIEINGEKVTELPDEVPSGSVIKVKYVKEIFYYVVEYYYDNVKDGSKTNSFEVNFGDIINEYEDKPEYGYKFEKVTNLPLTVSENTDKNIINVYYVRKDSTVKIKYVDKQTGEEISEEVIKQGKVFDTFDISGDKKEIEGYTLIESPEILTGKYEEEEQIFTYYYAKNTKVIVNHIDKNKINSEAEEIPESAILLQEIENGVVGQGYTASAKNFEKYVLMEKPEQEKVIMTREEIVLNYYYVHVSAGVIEKHVDIKTNQILDNTLHEGNEGDPYSTKEKEFEGYDIVTNKQFDEKVTENPDDKYIPENAEGIMTVEPIEVIYYYIRKTSVKVEYIDKITGEIIKEKVENSQEEKDCIEYMYGHQGDSYETEEKKFEGYDIVKEMYPENSKGTMEVTRKEDGTVSTETLVKYYYVKISAGVKERHIDEKTGKLLEEEIVHQGHEGDEYNIISKEFDGYDLIKEKLPTNSKGKMEVEPITVDYYYVRKTEVIVEYIDKITGEKIPELDESEENSNTDKNNNNKENDSDKKKQTGKDSTVKIEGHEGDNYKTEEKKFKDYVIVKEMYPENAEGKMTVERKEDSSVNTTTYVRYYYVHISGGIVEQHIDIKTEELLEEETKHEGNEGDSYSIKAKEFEDYDLVEEKIPENAEGKMAIEQIEVKYYYIRKARVKVEYLKLGTDEKVAEDVIIEGHEGDKYKTESKNINGFDLVEEKVPKNAEGEMTKEEIVVKYYYKSNVTNNASSNGNNLNSSSNNNSNNQIVNPVVNTKNNTPSNNGGNASSNKNVEQQNNTPNTGDTTPIISIEIIIMTILINMTQIIINKKRTKNFYKN